MKKAYAFWLGSLYKLLPVYKKELIGALGSAQAAYEAPEREIRSLLGEERAAYFMAEKRKSGGAAAVVATYRQHLARGMDYISIEESTFPEKLRVFPNDPYGLYVIGEKPDGAFCVAIVGARKSTAYGETMARRIGGRLGKSGIPVISGMARGIDSAAQRSALDAGGTTTAVLGCGANVCYPSFMKKLYGDILKKGSILSEYPPDTEPKPFFFPVRNRIIAALSDLVIVLEGGLKSGSLITARLALDYGRDVYALPGRIEDAKSAGCNELIREGAQILTSEEALFEDPLFTERLRAFGGTAERKAVKPAEGAAKIQLAPPDDLLYSCVGFSPKSLEEIQQESGLSAEALLARLTMLELSGLLKQQAPGWFVRA